MRQHPAVGSADSFHRMDQGRHCLADCWPYFGKRTVVDMGRTDHRLTKFNTKSPCFISGRDHGWRDQVAHRTDHARWQRHVRDHGQERLRPGLRRHRGDRRGQAFAAEGTAQLLGHHPGPHHPGVAAAGRQRRRRSGGLHHRDGRGGHEQLEAGAGLLPQDQLHRQELDGGQEVRVPRPRREHVRRLGPAGRALCHRQESVWPARCARTAGHLVLLAEHLQYQVDSACVHWRKACYR